MSFLSNEHYNMTNYIMSIPNGAAGGGNDRQGVQGENINNNARGGERKPRNYKNGNMNNNNNNNPRY